ncbi:class I SAM-dependent methyltransferase [Duganella violaceipulchra]|uniref:SAM-dependent methyltransferase n=1 Tax=Duganella violaceipulchra TaxID=2849652 RepID=A0AA41L137_9BURK|nr:class I SAM-dependent methyltransferase [Duganella violaceicalia]MBV6324131.1 class I SAM-dependent methyltransferase [Duganella violaceicalia]MCP2011936.1 SAM-dependent methyltransferase [Duganella violaceicalia]
MSLQNNSTDLAFLEQNAASIRNAKLHIPHLDQTVNLLNYMRIADHVATTVQQPAARIMDWGCGYGQMTWLLRRRNFDMISFDIGADDTCLPPIPLCDGLNVIRTTHPTQLPFPEQAFDAVLSCGVLEHIDECSGVAGNELKSLAEIARVLRPEGKLLIYQLPQRASWQEALVRRLKLGYTHPRRYSAAEIVGILEGKGFRVSSLRRANLVPKNLTGMPTGLRRIYSRFSLPLIVLDRYLCRIPLLNRVAGVLEIVAVKRPDAA